MTESESRGQTEQPSALSADSDAVIPGESPPASSSDAEIPVPKPDLRPPLPTWAVVLLTFCTFGVYVLPWMYGISRERLRKEGRSAWWPTLLVLVPCANLIVLRRTIEYVNRLARRAGSPRVKEWTVWAAVVLAGVVGAADRRVESLWTTAIVVALHASWVGLLQRVRVRAWAAAWNQKPRRLRAREYSVFVVLLAVVGFLGYQRQDLIAYWRGKTLSPGATLITKDGRFALKVPAKGWVQVAPGGLQVGDADFELIGPGNGTRVIVRSFDSGSLDEVVDARRGTLLAADATVLNEERYYLQGADLVLVSNARYATKDVPGVEYIAYTLLDERHALEIVAFELGEQLSEAGKTLIRSAAPHRKGGAQ